MKALYIILGVLFVVFSYAEFCNDCEPTRSGGYEKINGEWVKVCEIYPEPDYECIANKRVK